MIDIEHEIFVEDVYRAARTIQEGDRWVDVGCHIGWFSKLVEDHGAVAVAGIDMDGANLTEYLIDEPHRIGVCAEIITSDDLLAVLEPQEPTAAKLDIQGAEIVLLDEGVLPRIEEFGIRKLLLEWHHPFELYRLVRKLVGHEWRIEFIESAIDALTDQPTHIVFATLID